MTDQKVPNIGEQFNPYGIFPGFYVPDPIAVLPGIGFGAKLCYAVLLRHNGRAGVCYPSVKKIGEQLGTSTRMVQNYLRELERSALIIRIPWPGRSNRYAFLFHEAFATPTPRMKNPSRVDVGESVVGGVKASAQLGVKSHSARARNSFHQNKKTEEMSWKEMKEESLQATDPEASHVADPAMALTHQFEVWKRLFRGPIEGAAFRLFTYVGRNPDQLSALLVNTPLWMDTAAYRDGFHSAQNFLRSEVWLEPPKQETIRRPKKHNSATLNAAAMWLSNKENPQ